MVGPSPGLMLFTDRKSLLIIEEKEDSSRISKSVGYWTLLKGQISGAACEHVLSDIMEPGHQARIRGKH